MKKEITITEFHFSATEAKQVLNMGGPWVSSLWQNDHFISDNCIVDNFLFSESRGLLFFIKFHVVTKFYYYFTINFYNTGDNRVFEFSREFNMVFIKQFVSENKIEIFHAFHDQITSNRDIFNLDNEDFEQI